MADCDPNECGGACNPPAVSIPCDPQGVPYSTPVSCAPPQIDSTGVEIEDSLTATLPSSTTPWTLSQHPDGVDPDMVTITDSSVDLPVPGDYQFYNGTSYVVISATTSFSYNVTCSGEPLSATLCGFDEFEASSPPKKFRRKVTSGSFSICDFPIEDCSVPTCPGSVSLSFSGNIPGFPDLVVASGALTYNGPATGGLESSYTCAASAAYGTTPIGARIRTDLNGETIFADGDTKNVSAGVVGAAALDVFLSSFHQVDSACMKSGLIGIQVQWDNWSLTEEYDSETCEVQTTDAGVRTTGSELECSDPGGVGSDIPCSNPAECYGASIDVVSPVRVDYNGSGCSNNGDGTSTSVGTSLASPLKSELSIEDTEEDAINRAKNNEDPAPPSGATCPTFDPLDCCLSYYSARDAFQFFYKEATIDAAAEGLDPDEIYALRVHYYDGDYGVASDYSFAGTIDYPIVVNTDGTGTVSHVITPTRGKQTAATMMSVVKLS